MTEQLTPNVRQWLRIVARICRRLERDGEAVE